MRGSLLLVGDDPKLLWSRRLLLESCGQVNTATSSNAEAVIVTQAFNLVLLCQTVPEGVTRKVLEMASALDPRPVIMVINGAEEHRSLGAAICHVQITDPGWLQRTVADLLQESHRSSVF
jgi:CheY-like chemotaxis protein